MNPIKKLASQTAIYGLPSILGRLLNYLLVPILTGLFDPFEYGVVQEFYAYVTFFMVLLTFGLETTYFRFVNKSDNPEKTFNEIFSLVLIINGLFLLFALVFSQAIANWMLYPQYQNFVIWLAFILVFDALSSLLLAKIRYQENAKRFAFIQLFSILLNIVLTLVFFLYAKVQVDSGEGGSLASFLYNPIIGVGYVFLANLFASLVKLGMLYKEMLSFKFIWSQAQAKVFFLFAAPIAIAGFAGMINEALDRILIKRLLLKNGPDFATAQVGIYSANYKLSIIISLVIQAFRYAAEPFFFAQEKAENRNKIYAKVMNYFVALVTLIFVGVSLNLDIFKWFIPNELYWEGLSIVPVLLLANVFLGIYYNQSIWYKLADKPMYGAYISFIGAGITVVLNLITIPILGYVGSAYTTLVVYMSMSIISWYWGQKKFPIKYNLRKVLLYLIASVVLVLLGLLIQGDSVKFNIILGMIFTAMFFGLIMFMERPLSLLKKS